MQSLLGAAFTSLSEVCSDEFMALHWEVIEHAHVGNRMFDLLISWLDYLTGFLLAFADWLLGSGEEIHATWYLNGLKDALEEFFADHANANEAQSAVKAEELAAWSSAAERSVLYSV